MTMTANIKELKWHLSDAQCLLDELKECQAILRATFHALNENKPKEASFLLGLYNRQSSDDIGELEYHFEQMKTYLGD